MVCCRTTCTFQWEAWMLTSAAVTRPHCQPSPGPPPKQHPSSAHSQHPCSSQLATVLPTATKPCFQHSPGMGDHPRQHSSAPSQHPCSSLQDMHQLHLCSSQATHLLHPCSSLQGVYLQHLCSGALGMHQQQPYSSLQGMLPQNLCSRREGICLQPPCSSLPDMYPQRPCSSSRQGMRLHQQCNGQEDTHLQHPCSSQQGIVCRVLGPQLALITMGMQARQRALGTSTGMQARQ